MQEIFAALPAILKMYADDEDVRRSVVFAAWRRISGESLAYRTAPVELDGSTLRIAVADRTWQRNLKPLAGEMVFRLNSLIGATEVTFIEFRVDREALAVAERDSGDPARLEAEALDEITEPLRKAADHIQNDELRRRFLLAAGSCLAREKRIGSA
jgi:hypothetical protein